MVVGRERQWPPGWWRESGWGEFAAEVERLREYGDEDERPRRPLSRPSVGEFRETPWAGDGGDPLEAVTV